jgi:predicted lactoylglutathione lyase
MKKALLLTSGLALFFFLGFYAKSTDASNGSYQLGENDTIVKKDDLRLGIFSISLNVKDLKKSKEFYEKLGFSDMGGDMKYNYLIMKNENTVIGLFQGMFEDNILTFNPGWDANAQNLEEFQDIREIQKHLKNEGLKLDMEASDTTTGPASIMLKDPDGNLILLDQHR